MVELLSKDALLTTGSVDHADWNYRPVLGLIQRLRFWLICRLLPKRRPRRLLEIGYGSGVFMPELARHCDELYGIDIHEFAPEVQQRLAERGVKAKLSMASAELLPFEDNSFDCIVAVSSLEFIPDIQRAVAEFVRVLQPNGILVLVTPGHSPLIDMGLRLLTGEVANKDYGKRREALMPAILDKFSTQRVIKIPPLFNRLICLYSAYRLTPKSSLPKKPR